MKRSSDSLPPAPNKYRKVEHGQPESVPIVPQQQLGSPSAIPQTTMPPGPTTTSFPPNTLPPASATTRAVAPSFPGAIPPVKSVVKQPDPTPPAITHVTSAPPSVTTRQQSSAPTFSAPTPTQTPTPAPPPPPSSNQPLATAVSPPTAASNDAENQEKVSKQKHAMDFLYKVRDQYANNPSTYNEFLEIMKGFKSGSIETSDVIHRVKELFKGNDYLIEEFNLFLPPGFKIEPDKPEPVVVSNNTTPEPQNVAQGDLEQARGYVRKIKNRFALQPQIYKNFLEILHGYYQGQHAITDVLNEVAELFHNHQDLLMEFRHFLPKSVSAATPRINTASSATAPATAKKPKKKKEKGEKHERETRSMTSSDATAPLLANLTSASPMVGLVTPMGAVPQPYSKRKEKEDRKQALLQAEERKRSKREEKKKQQAAATVMSSIISSTQEKKELPVVNHQDAVVHTEFNYYYEVKQQLNSKYLYHQFLSAISLYSQEVLTKAELMYLTHGILVKHRELYESFKQFINFNENSEEFYGDPISQPDQLGEDLREMNTMLNETNTTLTMLETVVEKCKQNNTPITLANLDINYLQHIEYLYGPRGPELLEALFNDPPTVVPIVIRRLKQKTREWEELRAIARSRAREQVRGEQVAPVSQNNAEAN